MPFNAPSTTAACNDLFKKSDDLIVRAIPHELSGCFVTQLMNLHSPEPIKGMRIVSINTHSPTQYRCSRCTLDSRIASMRTQWGRRKA